MKKNKFQVLFCFYCASKSRRLYLKNCIDSLTKFKTNLETSYLVIDGSPKDQLEKNRKIFAKIKDVSYIEDGEPNPIKRLARNLKYIRSDYVLWLLEDCLFLQQV